jgi:hypothetical protein
MADSMTLASKFAEPSKPRSSAYSYGFLAFILLLLAIDLFRLSRSSVGSLHIATGNCVVVLMLLFNHLAYQFRFSPQATVALRILAWGWVVFGLAYVISWMAIVNNLY